MALSTVNLTWGSLTLYGTDLFFAGRKIIQLNFTVIYKPKCDVCSAKILEIKKTKKNWPNGRKVHSRTNHDLAAQHRLAVISSPRSARRYRLVRRFCNWCKLYRAQHQGRLSYSKSLCPFVTNRSCERRLEITLWSIWGANRKPILYFLLAPFSTS